MASIQGVYVALFGRPADPTGLNFFKGETNDGADLTKIGDLAATAEYKARFDGQTNAQIITSIYQSLFGRNPEQAGLDFFVKALANGTFTINNIAIAILDGAQGDDKTLVDKKIAAADKFTAALDTPDEVAAYQGTAAGQKGIDFLKAVTSTSTAVSDAAAQTAVDGVVALKDTGGTGSTGKNFALTAGVDFIDPNQADATKQSGDGNDSFISTANGQLTTGDNIDGGKGDDKATMILDNAGGETNLKPTLKSVESLEVSADGATNDLKDDSTIDLGSTEGLNTFTSKLAKISVTAKTLTIDNANKGTKVNIEGLDTDAAETGTVDINFASATGSSDSASIGLKDVKDTGTTIIDVAAIETLTVDVTGNSNAHLAIANTKKLIVTGDKKLTIEDASTNLSALTELDASGNKGGIVVDLQNAGTSPANGVTVTGSSVMDTIGLNNGENDVVVYNTSNVSTLSKTDDINAFVSGEDKIDLKAFDLSSLKSDAVLAAGVAPAGDIADFFKDGGDSYAVAINGNNVYVDIDKDGNFDAGSDLVIDVNAAPAIGDFIFS